MRWPARIKLHHRGDAHYHHRLLPDISRGAACALTGDRRLTARLVPLFKGSGRLRRDTLYWHYPLASPHFLGGRSSGAIRHGDFKLIEFYDTGSRAYNLRNDVGEQRDLAPAMPGKVSELRRMLHSWRKQ